MPISLYYVAGNMNNADSDLSINETNAKHVSVTVGDSTIIGAFHKFFWSRKLHKLC